jgi:hypothetical protein
MCICASVPIHSVIKSVPVSRYNKLPGRESCFVAAHDRHLLFCGRFGDAILTESCSYHRHYFRVLRCSPGIEHHFARQNRITATTILGSDHQGESHFTVPGTLSITCLLRVYSGDKHTLFFLVHRIWPL